MMKKMICASARDSRRGFTLVELAIVMAVAGLLFAGLWRIMSNSSTQMRDQAAADIQRQVIAGVQGYLTSSEGQTLLAALDSTVPANQVCQLPLSGGVGSCTTFGANAATVATYLPAGFTNATTNSYGQAFQVYVRKDSGGVAGTVPTSYSFMVMTVNGEVVPDSSGGRIAGMIGNDGGFRYSAAAGVCGAATLVCGAYGVWSLDPATNYGSAVAGGHIASRTYNGRYGIGSDTYWLARMNVPGDTSVGTVNTLNAVVAGTNISLGSNTLFGSNTAGAYGGSLQNIEYFLGGRAGNLGNPGVRLMSPCQKANKADATCDYILEVQGDASFSALLVSNKFSAEQYIYETTASDERLKKDIVPIEHPLKRIAALNGYSFTYVDGKETRYGVLAQEVAKEFPELVHEDAAGNKSVDYMGLVGPLVAAVRELKEENDKLREELATQGKRMGVLEVKAKR